MMYRKLGRTGLSVSPVIFGGNVLGWTLDEQASHKVLDAFFAGGLNTIDTADVYSSWAPGNSGGESETIIGNWMKARGMSRDKAVIITKAGSDVGYGKSLRKAYIMEAVERSLKRLQTDHIDLYLAHWPDPDTPYEETLSAFSTLRDQGKIRAFGCSNLDASQLQASLDAAKAAGLPRYDVLQPEYNLVERDQFEGPLADLCVQEDIGVITYYSLASGFLTGKYRGAADLGGGARSGSVEKYMNERGMRVLAALDEAAAESGAKPAEVAIAWLLTRPGVTAPIASATSTSQVESLVKAASLELSEGALARLESASA